MIEISFWEVQERVPFERRSFNPSEKGLNLEL
jgi:hypothetical protein